ncbi:MAG: protein kinase, partial [Planctomycetota bacterium]
MNDTRSPDSVPDPPDHEERIPRPPRAARLQPRSGRGPAARSASGDTRDPDDDMAASGANDPAVPAATRRPGVPGVPVRKSGERPTPATPQPPGAVRASSASGLVQLGGDLPRSEEGYSRFRIGDELGRGAAGMVLAANDPLLRRDVAVKQLQMSFDPDLIADFVDEAQITGQLEHPNIIPVHEFGFTPDGAPYLVMKRVHGSDLDQLIEALDKRARELMEQGKTEEDERELAREERRLLDVFYKVCDAVAYSHSRGVIHRDLNPENVMVGEYGEVLLVDWGVARPIRHPDRGADRSRSVTTDRREAAADRTMQGQITGTPQFMSPEQARGEQDQLDERTDIYGLGAMLYNIVAGVPAFTGPVDRVLEQVRTGRVRPPSHRARGRHVARELEAVILKAMAFKKDDRYASVEELRADLDAFREGRTLHAAQYSTAQLVWKWAARHKAAVAVAAAALVLVISLVAYFIVQVDGERRAAVAAQQEASLKAQQATDANERILAEIRAAKQARAETEVRRREASTAADVAMAFRARMALNERDALSAIALLAGRRTSLNDAASLMVPAPVAVFDGGLYGHTDDVRSVMYSPDGRNILSASTDGTMRIWDVNDRRAAPVVISDPDMVQVLYARYSRSGDRIVAVRRLRNRDGEKAVPTTIYDTATGRESLSVYTGAFPASGPEKAAISPDGLTLAVATRDGMIRLFDAFDGRASATLSGHQGQISMIAWFPDSRRLLSGGADRTLRIFDVNSGTAIALLRGHTNLIRSVAVSPDGRMVASAGFDSTLRLWDVETQQQLGQSDFPDTWVVSVAFSEDGQWVAAGAEDGTVRIINVRSRRLEAQIQAHSSRVWSVAFNFDGTRLATGAADGTVRTWRLMRDVPQLLTGHELEIRSIAFSPDGRRMATSSDDETVRIWDLSRRMQLARLGGHRRRVTSVAYTPDGKFVVSGSEDDTARMWDVESKQCVWTMETEHDIDSVDVSPDGALVVTAGHDHAIRLWDVGKQALSGILEGHRDDMNAVVFSPDGSLLASACDDGLIGLWDTRKRESIAWMQGHTAPVQCLAFSPDGRTLLSGGADQTARLWDVETHRLAFTFDQIEAAITSVCFSRDGNFAIVGPGDQSIIFFNTTTHREAFRMKDQQRVSAMAMSPTGNLLATGRMDAVLHIWGGFVPDTLDRASRITGMYRDMFA